MLPRQTCYRLRYVDKLILNEYVLNFCALPQKLIYIVCLFFETKQLTHEKLHYLPSQNLKYKQASSTGNHHLKKNNIMKFLCHCQVFSFANSVQYIPLFPSILPIHILVLQLWLLYFYLFFFNFTPFSKVSYTRDNCTKYLKVLSTLKFLDNSFGSRSLLPTLWLFLKLLEVFMQPSNYKKIHQNF